MFSLPESRRFSAPLTLLFWGLVLVILPVPLPAWGPVALARLPDLLGAALMVLATARLTAIEVDERYWEWTQAASVVALLVLLGAVGNMLLPLAGPVMGMGGGAPRAVRQVFLFFPAAAVLPLLPAALAIRHWCRCAERPGQGLSWLVSAILLVTNVMLPLAAIALAWLWQHVAPVWWTRQMPLAIILVPLIAIGLGHFYANATTIADGSAVANRQQHLGFVWKGAAVVYLAALILLGALTWAVHERPREDDLFEQLIRDQLTPREAGKQPPFWKRWFSSPSPPRRPRGGKQPKVVRRQPATGSGTPGGSHNLGPAHLAMRELAEAQQLLTTHPGIDDREAWQTVREARINGPFREFEDARFVSRMLLHEFIDNPHDPDTIERWAAAAKKTLDQPHTAFEERFYGGVALLMTGKAADALPILEQAMREWPAPGSGYGNCYFFVMVSHAVLGHTDDVFDMLDNFRDVHPDWLYPENYLPDLIDVRRAYPRTPLLDLMEGRLQFFVNDYAKAETLWDRALRSNELSGPAAARTRLWLLQVRKERQP